MHDLVNLCEWHQNFGLFFLFASLDVEDSIIGKEILIDEPTIRSKRRLERRLKKRKASKKPSDDVYKVASSMAMNISKKLHKNHNQNDPLGLFLGLPETKQLLTVKEEKVLFAQIQACISPILSSLLC